MQFGTLADRLGNGLQNRVEQFDSARYLFKSGIPKGFRFFVIHSALPFLLVFVIYLSTSNTDIPFCYILTHSLRQVHILGRYCNNT